MEKYYAVYAEGQGTFCFKIVDQESWDWIDDKTGKYDDRVKAKYAAFIESEEGEHYDIDLKETCINDRAMEAPPAVVNGEQSKDYIRIKPFIAFLLKHNIEIEDEYQGALY